MYATIRNTCEQAVLSCGSGTIHSQRLRDQAYANTTCWSGGEYKVRLVSGKCIAGGTGTTVQIHFFSPRVCLAAEMGNNYKTQTT